MANAFFTRPMTALKHALSRLDKAKKRLIVPLLLAAGCASVPEIDQVPAVVLGEPSFFPTIAAHTDAPIAGGNRVDLLFNGEQIFPAMLQAIRGARKSITYAQYLYKGGAIAYELAEALAERCRAGVQVKILLDDHGGSSLKIYKRFQQERPTSANCFSITSISGDGMLNTVRYSSTKGSQILSPLSSDPCNMITWPAEAESAFR